MTVVLGLFRLLAPQLDRETHTKDIDFSPSGIMQRWDAGYTHTNAVLQRSPWVGEFDPLSGVILHEQMELLPEAAGAVGTKRTCLSCPFMSAVRR